MRAQRGRTSGLAVLGLLCLVACGGKQNKPPPVVAQETAQEEVFRIARTWTSTQIEKSLLSPPSAVSMSASTRTSRLELGSTEGQEQLSIDEVFELRQGGKIRCQTRFEHTVSLRWGRKAGEAAVEITRPPLSATRSCDGPSPEPLLAENQRSALFVLNADALVAVDPPLDERIYRPISE